WEWVNRGAATAVKSNGRLVLTAPAAAAASYADRMLVQPAAGDFDVGSYCWLSTSSPDFVTTNYQEAGIIARESSSGKAVVFTVITFTGQAASPLALIYVGARSSPTAFAANISTSFQLRGRAATLRLKRVGSSLHCLYSENEGRSFLNIATVAVGSYFTTAPNQVGLIVSSYDTTAHSTIGTYEWFRGF
ncbi:MAG: hypothetical protein ACRDD1_17470, partial [Planctomycetia bacterium]